MASVLVRTLLETQQPVPEFLNHHVPEGEDLKQLKFESENEMGGAFGIEDGEVEGGGGWAAAEACDDAAAGGWGPSTGGEAVDHADASGGGWGAPATASGGW